MDETRYTLDELISARPCKFLYCNHVQKKTQQEQLFLALGHLTHEMATKKEIEKGFLVFTKKKDLSQQLWLHN